MARFNSEARLVRKAGLANGARYMAFRRAVCWYAALRRGSFPAIYADLAHRFSFDGDGRRPTPEQMIEALDHLTLERAAFLERLREFRAERRREKHGGQRQLRAGQLERIFPPRTPA